MLHFNNHDFPLRGVYSLTDSHGFNLESQPKGFWMEGIIEDRHEECTEFKLTFSVSER
jgi:hypothetical protein